MKSAPSQPPSKNEETRIAGAVDRRTAVGWICKGLGLGMGLKVFETARKPYEEREQVTRDLRELSLAVKEKIGQHGDRVRMLAEVFGMQGEFPVLYHAGNDHPVPSSVVDRRYTHEYRGLAPYVNTEIPEVDAPWAEDPVPGSCILTSGSPVSNELARQYIPLDTEDPTDRVRPKAEEGLRVNANEVPYWFYSGGVDLSLVYSMRQKGQQKRTRLNGITYKTEIDGSPIRKRFTLGSSSTGWLEEDFLLVSRLPLYSNDGMICGTIVIAAGGHGAGTEAFGLLADPKMFSGNDLICLYDRVKDHYFQAVFRVKVKHDDAKQMTCPVGIVLERDGVAAPVRIDPSDRFLNQSRHG